MAQTASASMPAKKNNQTVNDSLYSLRTLACIGVLLVHAPLPTKAGIMLQTLSRWAVPFFFITSGYFAYRAGKERIARRRGKTLKLCIVFFFAYVALNAALQAYSGTLNQELLANLANPADWFLFLVCNWTTPFAGCGHLWYLFAMLYVYEIFIHLPADRISPLIPRVIIAALCVTTIFQLANNTFSLGLNDVLWRNFAFEGLPMFLTGYYIAYARKSATPLPTWVERIRRMGWVPAAAIIAALYAAELGIHMVNHQWEQLPLSAVVFAVAVFVAALRHPTHSIFAWYGRNCADKVYLLHYAVIMLLVAFAPSRNPWTSFPITFVVASILALGWLMCSKVLHINRTRKVAS